MSTTTPTTTDPALTALLEKLHNTAIGQAALREMDAETLAQRRAAVEAIAALDARRDTDLPRLNTRIADLEGELARLEAERAGVRLALDQLRQDRSLRSNRLDLARSVHERALEATTPAVIWAFIDELEARILEADRRRFAFGTGEPRLHIPSGRTIYSETASNGAAVETMIAACRAAIVAARELRYRANDIPEAIAALRSTIPDWSTLEQRDTTPARWPYVWPFLGQLARLRS